MPNKIPTVREISWLSAIPQLAVMAVLIGSALAILTDRPAGLAVGAIAYLVLSRSLKAILAKHHERGIRLLHANRFEEGINAFERSYAFFSSHSWLDRWRYLTLLSSSSYSYRELALCNIAFANLQLSRLQPALNAYRKAVSEFPGCELARLSIQALETAKRESAG